MWWIREGEFPTVDEAVEKLDYLQKNEASELVFDFKKKFPLPDLTNEQPFVFND